MSNELESLRAMEQQLRILFDEGGTHCLECDDEDCDGHLCDNIDADEVLRLLADVRRARTLDALALGPQDNADGSSPT